MALCKMITLLSFPYFLVLCLGTLHCVLVFQCPKSSGLFSFELYADYRNFTSRMRATSSALNYRV
uniref:Uncharacterized protein n=1 Tax=Arundo donax TaxID=35708 RepID=A0A0A9B9N6_ARUDO